MSHRRSSAHSCFSTLVLTLPPDMLFMLICACYHCPVLSFEGLRVSLGSYAHRPRARRHRHSATCSDHPAPLPPNALLIRCPEPQPEDWETLPDENEDGQEIPVIELDDGPEINPTQDDSLFAFVDHNGV